MINLLDFEPWWRFGVALLIGALLGMEREFIQQKEDAADFAGIRTFSLIALLGSVTAFMATDFDILLIALSLGGLILLITVSYFGKLKGNKRVIGITTEVAVMLTFLFGVLVMGDQSKVAIALAVLTSLMLALKGRLHGFIRRMSDEDLRVTLQFALVAAVILPLLPDRAIDPLGILNPFQVWLMVVLVSGIGFSGYILMKVLGPSRGINLTGILGGLASSTATTISFSTASRKNPAMSKHYARAVVLASSMMLPRVLFLILVIYPPLLRVVSLPLAAMLVSGLALVFFLQRKDTITESDFERSFDVAHPLKLSTAIKFGLVFAIIFIGIEFAQSSFGSIGVYFASASAGLMSMNAATLSIVQLLSQAQLDLQVAGVAIVIAAIMNTISKGAIVYFTGSQALRRIVIRSFGVVLLAGLLSSTLILWLT
ncbi:MAG: MgtC/SapB family protein [Chloroflexota bacterium]